MYDTNKPYTLEEFDRVIGTVGSKTESGRRIRETVVALDKARAEIDELAAALKSWVDVMDNLSQDPDDPAVVIRQQYHGKRLEQSRAALAKVML